MLEIKSKVSCRQNNVEFFERSVQVARFKVTLDEGQLSLGCFDGQHLLKVVGERTVVRNYSNVCTHGGEETFFTKNRVLFTGHFREAPIVRLLNVNSTRQFSSCTLKSVSDVCQVFFVSSDADQRIIRLDSSCLFGKLEFKLII